MRVIERTNKMRLGPSDFLWWIPLSINAVRLCGETHVDSRWEVNPCLCVSGRECCAMKRGREMGVSAPPTTNLCFSTLRNDTLLRLKKTTFVFSKKQKKKAK